MIELKGMADAVIRCVIPETLSDEQLIQAFSEAISKGGQVLANARVVLDFQGRAISSNLIAQVMINFVEVSRVNVISWITYDAESLERLKRMGISVGEPRPNVVKTQGALLLKRSLRSGQKVEHSGDVILCGHLNDGAEILATGHVVVLGRLNGLVHAGVEGDEGASITTRALNALQVRIGRKVGVLDKKASTWGKPAIMTVENDAVLISDWPA